MNKAWLPNILLYPSLAVILLISSCSAKRSQTGQNTGRNKIYIGQLSIDADPALKSIISQEQFIFQSYHDSVQVTIEYKDEAAMFDDFRNKRVALLILSRMLTDKEKESLKNVDTIYTRELNVAYDAVALIGNKEFNDNTLTMDGLRADFNPKNTSKANDLPRMVFDKQNTSIVKYVLNLLGYTDQVSSNVYAVNSPTDVIDYVQGNKDAIGFIPYAIVSDRDDDSVKTLLNRIKILSLPAKYDSGRMVRTSANQSDIATGIYPLIRSINTVARYGYRDDLDLLFVNFLDKEKGARIFLKAGYVPNRIPEREINVNTDSLNIPD